MGRNFNTFIKKLEGNFAISDNFHRFTKNKSVSARSYGQKIPNSWIEIHFKTYPRLNKINLLKTKAIGVLERTLLKRRSIRNFSGRAISLKDLSKILFFSAGIINSSSQLNNTKRSYPSAGARYPLELYCSYYYFFYTQIGFIGLGCQCNWR
ncbi:MAG: hypothetical protein M1365_00355 [Actinobacteria bacterium]|nr:hypothetical protein [Actinomycetota bacterium]